METDKGEIILLCGRSGSGKTTITKLVNGLITHYPKTQFFNLDSDSELTFGLENMGEDPSEIKKKVSKAVSDLGIERLVNRNVFKMSGGEKQLLAIASIYATSPEIYVFDEPSANIDEYGIEKIRETLIKLKAQGKTIIISEHRLYYLMDLLNRAIYLQDGEIKYIFEGLELASLNDESRRKLCYMVMQDVINQLFSESIIEEFELSDSKIKKEEVEEILTKLDLIRFKDKHPLCLSGGQMQRLAVAVGVLMNREIIIFDEPTSGLDYFNMLKISEVIKNFSKDKIVFIVTHDKELIDNICNKLLEISNGKINKFCERR